MSVSANQALRRRINDWKAIRRRRRILLLEDVHAGYLPIPKVASTSLRQLVCQRQARLLYPAIAEEKRLRTLQKRTERKIRRSLDPEAALRLSETWFLFSFVRNPLMRLYSCYRDKVIKASQLGKTFSLAPYGVKPGMSFTEFVQCIAEIPDERAEQHFRSQHCFLLHQDHWLVHYLGRFEELDRDWDTLSSQVGLNINPTVDRSSGAGSELDKLPLEGKAARLAVERYRRDIDLFGYREEVDAWLQRVSREDPRGEEG